MAAQFVPLRSISALGNLVERSSEQPVALLQHDLDCCISRRAYRELEGAAVETALVDVAQDEALSRIIEEQTGVRHESPQMLVFHSGKVVWNASHFKITGRAVTCALRRAASGDVVEERGLASGATLKRAASNCLNALRWLRSRWDRQ